MFEEEKERGRERYPAQTESAVVVRLPFIERLLLSFLLPILPLRGQNPGEIRWRGSHAAALREGEETGASLSPNKYVFIEKGKIILLRLQTMAVKTPRVGRWSGRSGTSDAEREGGPPWRISTTHPWNRIHVSPSRPPRFSPPSGRRVNLTPRSTIFFREEGGCSR